MYAHVSVVCARSAEVQTAVNGLVYTGGTTNTAEALRMADAMFSPTRGDRAGVQNIIVLVTDGNSDNKVARTCCEDKLRCLVSLIVLRLEEQTEKKGMLPFMYSKMYTNSVVMLLQFVTSRAASTAKQRGAHIIVLGVSDWIDRFEVYNVASDPYDYNALFIDDFLQFDAVSGRLIDMICDSEQPSIVLHRYSLVACLTLSVASPIHLNSTSTYIILYLINDVCMMIKHCLMQILTTVKA